MNLWQRLVDRKLSGYKTAGGYLFRNNEDAAQTAIEELRVWLADDRLIEEIAGLLDRNSHFIHDTVAEMILGRLIVLVGRRDPMDPPGTPTEEDRCTTETTTNPNPPGGSQPSAGPGSTSVSPTGSPRSHSPLLAQESLGPRFRPTPSNVIPPAPPSPPTGPQSSHSPAGSGHSSHNPIRVAPSPLAPLSARRHLRLLPQATRLQPRQRPL